MSDTPNPFPGGPDGPDGPDPEKLQEMLRRMMAGEDVQNDPELAKMFSSMGLEGVDPGMMQMLQSQLQAMMSGSADGSFNVDLATDIARKSVAAQGDSSVSEATRRDVTQVVQVADLWLDEVTDMPAVGSVRALSRSEWVEQTMPVWKHLVDPVATGVGGAIQRAMRQQMRDFPGGELPPELGLPPGMSAEAMMSQMEPMIARMSSGMFGAQVGQALGALAGELVSGSEVGLPLVPGNPVTMLPANVAAFAEGVQIDPGEVHLYLAVREAARVRLFSEVAWLEPALIAAVQTYAGDISIDTDGIERAVSEADMSNPQSLQDALQGSLFTPEPSEAQQRALVQLERLLALVEGWVETVTRAAVTPHLPHADALAESVRRRRASGGPAERLFAQLVGLELRPRRMREAATLFATLEEQQDAAARDSVWDHPDHAPSAEDLENPAAYVARRTGGEEAAPPERDEMDDELERLLDQGRAELAAEQEPETGEQTPGGAPSEDDDTKDDDDGKGTTA